MAIDKTAPEFQHELEIPDDRSDWGKGLEPAPHSPDVIIVEAGGNWRESLAEAWPVIRAILIIFGFILLAMNTLSWSIAQTPTRWPPLLFAIIFFLVASEKGSRHQIFQFLFFYLVGLITALWI